MSMRLVTFLTERKARGERPAIIHFLDCAASSRKFITYSRVKSGSRLYFIRLDEQGNAEHAGEPYCTICSKMSLDAGIAEFVLWHKEGITVYKTKEYNEKSFGRSG
ncbi:hypothetical protein HYX14_02425 [Candidatus Woesearchaeota archaeon]|nr:hypothetical protein [Candidatus Woesearchaeota archaeon]